MLGTQPFQSEQNNKLLQLMYIYFDMIWSGMIYQITSFNELISKNKWQQTTSHLLAEDANIYATVILIAVSFY